MELILTPFQKRLKLPQNFFENDHTVIVLFLELVSGSSIPGLHTGCGGVQQSTTTPDKSIL